MGVANEGVFHHTCFVVHDVEKTANDLLTSLGIGPWNIWTIELPDAIVRGERQAISFRIALAEVGGSNYELATPLSGESVVTEYLKKHGPGFHHTCLTYPNLEALRSAKSELTNRGLEMVQSGSLGEVAEFCYFHVPAIDSVLELLYIGELPPPEMTIG